MEPPEVDSSQFSCGWLASRAVIEPPEVVAFTAPITSSKAMPPPRDISDDPGCSGDNIPLQISNPDAPHQFLYPNGTAGEPG
jgi:hypothetical protein